MKKEINIPENIRETTDLIAAVLKRIKESKPAQTKNPDSFKIRQKGAAAT